MPWREAPGRREVSLKLREPSWPGADWQLIFNAPDLAPMQESGSDLSARLAALRPGIERVFLPDYHSDWSLKATWMVYPTAVVVQATVIVVVVLHFRYAGVSGLTPTSCEI